MKHYFWRMPTKVSLLLHLRRLAHKGTDGATIVEFALLLPLFLILLLGVMDFSVMMTRWVLAENALNQISRVGIVNPAITVQNEIKQKTFGLIDFNKPSNCLRVRAFNTLSELNNAALLNTCAETCPNCTSGTAGTPGQFVLYQIIFAHDFITPIGGLLKLASNSKSSSLDNLVQFSSSTVLRNE